MSPSFEEFEETTDVKYLQQQLRDKRYVPEYVRVNRLSFYEMT